MKLPNDHPQRIALNDEVRARPHEPLVAPCRLSYVALLCDQEQREAGWKAACALCRQYKITPPNRDDLHFCAELGPFRLKWEQHTEFVSWMFIAEGVIAESFDRPAIALLPDEWVRSLPGQVIMAAHVVLVESTAMAINPGTIGARWFGGNLPVGGSLSDGAATALTDFHIHSDGFSRHLLLNHRTTPWQAGRIAQRLLELDTYRLMALLAYPAARAVEPLLAVSERELTEITRSMVTAGPDMEAALLDRLTRLEAAIEHQVMGTRNRFNAAAAYYELVRRRIDELRELRIQGLQTLREFTERRLAPAMNTCRSVAQRQESLSEHVARAARLLATRVEVTLEKQNQALLETMNQRARTLLRMQSTLESLSIVAVTYYVCGLVGHAAEALLTAGVHVRPESATAISIPIVGVVAWLVLHYIRNVIGRVSEA